VNQTTELTLEQEFSLKSFASDVQNMSLEQAREFLIDQHRNMLIQKTIFQQLLKHDWNLEIDKDLAVS
jgi:hypothetical protein